LLLLKRSDEQESALQDALAKLAGQKLADVFTSG